MRHHSLMQVVFILVLGTLIPIGKCQFSSFKEVELDDEYLGREDRSDDFYGDDDVELSESERFQKAVAAPYKYQFNVVDDEAQVYQYQKQQREKGIVNGEYSWVDGVGTRHVVVYRADETGYHVLDNRQEKNAIKIKERKPRKPKKNGSRRAKVEALRASKLGERGWRFNQIDNSVTKVLNPVTERTSLKVLKVKKNNIPESVRSFTPNFQNSVDSSSLDSFNKPKQRNSFKRKKNRHSNIKLVSKPAVPENDLIIRNRPAVKSGIDEKSLVANILSSFRGNQKNIVKNNLVQNRPISKNKKTLSLSIIDLIPTTEKSLGNEFDSILPNQPNHRQNRPQVTSSKKNYLNRIPIPELEAWKNKNKGTSRKDNIELVTLPPVTSPRPRILRPILTKNEREKFNPIFDQGLGAQRANAKKDRTLSKGVSNEPDPFATKGSPPVVISTTNLPVSRNVPNPIFKDESLSTSLPDAKQKKEDELIAQIKRQLYAILGQKRKQSKLNESNRQGNKNKPGKGARGPKITSNDLAGILSNLGISAKVSYLGNKGGNKPPKKTSAPKDKRKKKIRVVKSRPRLRRPPPTFANFGLVEIKEKNKSNKGLIVSKAKVEDNSLLRKIPGVSETDVPSRKNPNRRRKLLRVIKKLRPKSIRKIRPVKKDSKITKDKELFNLPLLKPSLSPSQNDLLADDAGVNTVANKVLIQAVLETENNVDGDVEESIRSQVFITPKSFPQNDITISRVEKTISSPDVDSPNPFSKSNQISSRKIVLPAKESVQLRKAESRSLRKNNPRKIFTLPPKVLQPIGFVHPSFTI